MKAYNASKKVYDAARMAIAGGVSLEQLLVLASIATAEDSGQVVKITDVAKRTKKPVSTTSRSLFELSEAGYIVYREHKIDRRIRTLSLSASARDLIARFT